MTRKSVAILLLYAALAAPATAKPYLHIGFNQVAGGLFTPIAGSSSQQEAGFITPAVEHDAGPGGLCIGSFCPGIGWNPMNLGYIGSTANIRDLVHGKAAFGPSVQTGEMVKTAARFLCHGLPGWGDIGTYSLLKAAFAPGQNGVYADVGIYSAFPINGFGDPKRLKGEGLLGFTLVKTFGAAPAP